MITWDEAKTCDNVPKEGEKGFDPERAGQKCGGRGYVMSTGDKAKMSVRYVKCEACDATWQVSFEPAPPAKIIARSPSTPPQT